MQPPLPLPKPQQLQNQAPRMAEERHTARGRSALRRRGTCWSCRRRCARRLAAPTPHQHQPPPPMQHLLQSCIEASARWTVASGDPRPELPSSQRWTEAQAAGRWSASAVVPRHQRHTRASHPPFRAADCSDVCLCVQLWVLAQLHEPGGRYFGKFLPPSRQRIFLKILPEIWICPNRERACLK